MNSKQLQYAIELAEVCNFSKVSEALNISQPALSKHIMRLENDLGVKLFDRNYVPLRLTAAGEYFVKVAKELLYKEEQLKRSLEYYRSGECGRLSIGISPFRCLYLIPQMAKKLQEKFPNVEIRVCDTNSAQIRKDMADGKLDFAIVNLPVEETLFEYQALEADVLVLAVPNEMMQGLSPTVVEGNLEMDFQDCAGLPFVVVESNKEMRRLFDQLCASVDVPPRIAMEVVGLTTAWAMAREGIGATLLPLQFLNGESLENHNLTLIRIKNNCYQRQPVIITRRGQYMSEYARYAIRLLTNADKSE